MEGDEAVRRGREALSGGHLCHVCGHQYPNPNPSAKLRRSHRRNCRKVTPAAEEEGAGPRNAADGRLVLGAGEGPGDGEEPGNGAASGGSSSPGSANGGGDSAEDKQNAEHAALNAARIQAITSDYIESGLIPNNSSETADEGNGTHSERPSTNGIQHKVPESFTEIGQLAVAHPTEREDCLEEYQDASSFLHQSDPEDGAAIACESDVPMEIKNLDKGSAGSSMAADVISLERYDTCKYQFSRESSMTDFPAGSEVENEAEYYAGNITSGLVGHEDDLILQSTDDCSADIDSNNTDVVVDSKSDKTYGSCECIGDLNPSSLQKCSLLKSDPESQSACSRKVGSFLKDGMEVDTMSEVSPREEIVESYPIGSETISNSGDELKLIHTESTSTDYSTERSSQNLSAQDTKGVQLPVDNSCLVNSVCSVPGYQNDPAVTNVDGMLKSIAEDNCSKGILVKDSVVDFSCEARPEQQEDICNRESATEVPTNYQVSTSQEHVTLLMDQVSSTKNPFNIDDTRSDDLFELASGYHLEAPNVFESEQEVDSSSQTVSNQTSVADGKHCPVSDDRMVAVSSKNGYAVDAGDASVSSSSDPAKNVFLHDASMNHDKEGESHTNDIIDVPSQVFPTEFGTMPVSQEINALSTSVEEKTVTEDTEAKNKTAVESIDDSEEKKQTQDASANEMTAVLHTDSVEEDKLAEDTGPKEVTEVQSTDNIHEEDQTGSAKKMVREFNTADVGNSQTDVTSKEEKTDEVQQTDNAEEKKQAPEANAKETNTVQSRDHAEEQKQAEGTVSLKGNKQNGEISAIGSRLNSARISVPLKVLLAEASLEGKEKKPSTKERVLSFTRRGAAKDDSSSAKQGSAGSDDQYWNSPAKMPHDNNVDKRSKVRKQPWMPFICCHSVH